MSHQGPLQISNAEAISYVQPCTFRNFIAARDGIVIHAYTNMLVEPEEPAVWEQGWLVPPEGGL